MLLCGKKLSSSQELVLWITFLSQKYVDKSRRYCSFLCRGYQSGYRFYFLLTEKKSSPKLLNSLKVRIGLTVLIMVIIVVAWLHGDIHSQAPWLYR